MTRPTARRCLAAALLLAAGTAAAIAAPGPMTREQASAVVEQRQTAMSHMLEAVERIVPRLGLTRAGAGPVNPAHWPLIADEAGAIRGLIAETGTLWAPATSPRLGAETNAEPAIWSLPLAFEGRYALARTALGELEAAAAAANPEAARASLCALVRACGACHGAFRVVDTASLIREGVAWSGQYPWCDRHYGALPAE